MDKVKIYILLRTRLKISKSFQSKEATVSHRHQ